MADEKAFPYFWIPSHGETFETSDSFASNHSDDLRYAAEEYAEHYHDNRDGWECSWPISFTVARPDGLVLGTVEVDREMQAVFRGSVLK